MKKKILLAIAALGVVALLAPTSALAVCNPPVTLGQSGYQCPGSLFCYVKSPGVDTIASIFGEFWTFGAGDPTDGLGDDNGSNEDDNWLTRYSPAYPIYMGGSWGTAGTDGCIANQPVSNQQQITVFSDQDASGTTGYYAVAVRDRTPGSSPQINYADLGVDLDLVPIPKPFITATNRVDANTTEVTVRCDTDSNGFYTDGTRTESEIVTGCNFYTQVLGRSSTPPADRDQASGWSLAGSAAVGATDTLTLNCASDSDAWVASSIALDSGYETLYVSANSTLIECGPNIAEPREPKFRLIERRDRDVARPRR